MRSVFVVRDRNGGLRDAVECDDMHLAYRVAHGSRRYYDKSMGWNSPHTLGLETWGANMSGTPSEATS